MSYNNTTMKLNDVARLLRLHPRTVLRHLLRWGLLAKYQKHRNFEFGDFQRNGPRGRTKDAHWHRGINYDIETADICKVFDITPTYLFVLQSGNDTLMTQNDVLALLGITQPTLSNWQTPAVIKQRYLVRYSYLSIKRIAAERAAYAEQRAKKAEEFAERMRQRAEMRKNLLAA